MEENPNTNKDNQSYDEKLVEVHFVQRTFMVPEDHLPIFSKPLVSKIFNPYIYTHDDIVMCADIFDSLLTKQGFYGLQASIEDPVRSVLLDPKVLSKTGTKYFKGVIISKSYEALVRTITEVIDAKNYERPQVVLRDDLIPMKKVFQSSDIELIAKVPSLIVSNKFYHVYKALGHKYSSYMSPEEIEEVYVEKDLDADKQVSKLSIENFVYEKSNFISVKSYKWLLDEGKFLGGPIQKDKERFFVWTANGNFYRVIHTTKKMENIVLKGEEGSTSKSSSESRRSVDENIVSKKKALNNLTTTAAKKYNQTGELPPPKTPPVKPGNESSPPKGPDIPIGPRLLDAITPVVLTFPDLKKWAKNITIDIQDDENLEKMAHSINCYSVVRSKAKSPNSHKFSAMFRALSVKYFIECIGGGRKQAIVLDWFGARRNNSFHPSQKDLKLEWIAAPDNVIAGDRARGFVRQPIPMVYDYVLFQDVYQSGSSYLTPLTPSVIRDVVRNSTSGMGYVICRSFFGYAGVDSEKYNEGAWYRDQNGLINFSPDVSGTSYAPHPDVNWLFTHRHIDGLDIASLVEFGPYTVFCVTPSPHAPQMLGPSLERKGVFEKVTIETVENPWFMPTEVPFLSKFLFSFDKEVVVHYPTFMEKNILYNSRTYTGALRDALNGSVVNSFLESRTVQFLKMRFPFFILTCQDQTVEAILHHERSQKTWDTAAYMQQIFPAEQTLTTARQAKPTGIFTTKYIGQKFFKGVALVTALFFLYKMRRMSKNHYSPAALGISAPSLICDYLSKVPLLGNVIRAFRDAGVEGYVKSLTSIEMNSISGDLLTQVKKIPKPAIQGLVSFFYVVVIAPLFEEWLRCFPKLSFLLNHVIESLEKLGYPGPIEMRIGLAKHNFIFHSLMMFMSWIGVPYPIRVLIHSAWNYTCMSASPYATLSDEQLKTINDAYLETPAPAAVKNFLVFALFSTGSLLYSLFSKKKRTSGPKENLESLLSARKEFKSPELPQALYELPQHSFLPSSNSLPYVPTMTEKVEKSFSMKFNGEQYVGVPLLSDVLYSVSESMEYKQGIFPLIVPHNLMFRPAPSFINLLNASIMRTANDPYKIYDESLMKKFLDGVNKLWDCVTDKRLLDYPTDVDMNISFAQAIAKMDGPKRKRLLNAYNNEEKYGQRYPESKSVSVKHDELIAAREIQGKRSIKPRAIVQFSPRFIMMQTAITHKVAEVYHDMYNITKVYTVYNSFLKKFFMVRYVFASGYTVPELDQLMEDILKNQDKVTIVVAGDDSLIFWGPLSLYYGYCTEGDFSAYDHTEGEGPMVIGDEKKFRRMNLPDDFIKGELNAAKLPFSIRMRKGDQILRLKIKTRPQMSSGSPSTTNGNSDHNIDFGYHSVASAGSGKTLTALALELGFLLKTRVHESVNHATFLKGWWVLDIRGNYRWLPLPSMILKVGKMMDDPCKIAKTQDYDLAVKRCLYALARSPGFVPFDYPIAGPMLHLMLAKGVESSLKIFHRFKRLEVPYNDIPLDQSILMEMYYYRYGITPDEIVSFHSQLSSITVIPVMFVHSVNSKLMVDYE